MLRSKPRLSAITLALAFLSTGRVVREVVNIKVQPSLLSCESQELTSAREEPCVPLMSSVSLILKDDVLQYGSTVSVL